MNGTVLLERDPAPPPDVQAREDMRWSDAHAFEAIGADRTGAALPDSGALWIDVPGPRLLFVDGAYRPEASDPGKVRVTRGSNILPGAPLADRAAREAKAGWVIALGAGGAIGTVQIVHLSSGGTSHLANKVVLEIDAQASIVETYAGSGWSNAGNWYELHRGARLMRALRVLKPDGAHSDFASVAVPEAASFIATALVAGCRAARLETRNVASGAGAYVEVSGALLARGDDRLDTFNLVDHAEPEGTSRQIWRAVAADRATTSLSARVGVRRHAQQTDGEQSLRGLLLDRTATVNLKPELEIFADDVKCAHGATVGELDRAALFYLASRGLPPARARALMTRAFVGDALERIGDEAVREAFVADADRWLGEGAAA